jgi:hypothetical protein
MLAAMCAIELNLYELSLVVGKKRKLEMRWKSSEARRRDHRRKNKHSSDAPRCTQSLVELGQVATRPSSGAPTLVAYVSIEKAQRAHVW